MVRSNITLITGITILIAFISIGCSQKAELSPAEGAMKATGLEDAAVSRVNGIEMLVEANAWTGREDVLEDVTPLRVTIENTGDDPLRIRYSEFALINRDGERYSALPPFETEGTVEERKLVEQYEPLSPGFDYYGFSVAPYYHPVYPHMPVYSGAYYIDPFYYDRHYTYWRKIDLPTTTMLHKALPDGVLDPDGRVSGFLYFEKVDPDDTKLIFNADLVNAADGDEFGMITMPFMVSAEGS